MKRSLHCNFITTYTGLPYLLGFRSHIQIVLTLFFRSKVIFFSKENILLTSLITLIIKTYFFVKFWYNKLILEYIIKEKK